LNDEKKRRNYDEFGVEEAMDIDFDEFFHEFDFDTMMTMMMGDVNYH
jgi:DnaJ-class molecular chaperone